MERGNWEIKLVQKRISYVNSAQIIVNSQFSMSEVSSFDVKMFYSFQNLQFVEI